MKGACAEIAMASGQDTAAFDDATAVAQQQAWRIA
jgi:hypothetical protein